MIMMDQRYYERIPLEGRIKIQNLEERNQKFEEEVGKINS